jgi:hypothetical protein
VFLRQALTAEIIVTPPNEFAVFLCVFAGRPGRCFYRHLYLPEQAMFAALPADLGFGAYAEPPQQPVQLALLPDGTGFIKEGVEYRWVAHSCYLTIYIQLPGRIVECAHLLLDHIEHSAIQPPGSNVE